ncbi:Uma2 family endonuclease [Alienimonas chondri]|uniref:Putative restriction endonuclease domain-containing protein n=1 Tax=Alienimonas chondri TaxID=2681879 RepID=A0ABX1VCC4_9PLAN|nr:Uma2 family endonuclease [Alienimonas chondri]NNJ25086.1 hypothetical protein [Alienimonas chondri]
MSAVIDSPIQAPRAPASSPGLTLADLLDRFGPIPGSRVVRDPAPGTATEEDHARINARGVGVFELIDGTLIEKAVSDLSSWLGGEFVRLLGNFVEPGKLGWVHPADGFFHFIDGLRAPDASFTPRAARPDGLRRQGYSDVPPALVVEVLSPGNTRREMERKRSIYFAAGVVRVWEVDPEARTAVIWAGPDDDRPLGPGDALVGDPVLPGFRIELNELFAAADLS